MTTPPPPPGDDRDEPVPGADGAESPVLDSFAAEEPAEPADAVTAPADAPAPAPAADAAPDAAPDPAELPGADGPDSPVLDSSAAEEEPAEPADAVTAPEAPPPAAGEPLTAPHGSEGLTTAPPRPPAQERPAQETPVVAVPPPATPLPTDAPPTDPAAAPAATAAPPVVPGGRGRAWLPLTAVGLAVALLAGATGWLAWQLRQQDRADTARVEAVAAARDAARLLFSYDHKTLQQDFEKGLAVTTGDFRSQYQRTTKDVVTPVATKYKAVVLAEVVEAAVIDARADEVTALVFLNQATTSTRVQGQQVDQSRVRMRLVPRDGRWLVEEVKAL